MNREKSQVLEGVLAIIVNVVLFVLKFWAGAVTGSIALIADAWHTLSDSLSSIFVVIAAKLASREADKEHPFGHGRMEHIASIFVAVLLAVIGYEFLTDAIERFQNRESVIYGTLAIVVTLVSVAAKEGLAQLAFYIGRKTDNSVVKADGWHHRTDALSSLIILIGILVARFTEGLWWMDSILGMICALLIFYAAYEILKEAVSKMLGEEPTQELTDKITGEVKKMYGDLRLHHFHLHNYVSHKEMSLHLMLDKAMSVEGGHKIASEIETMIKEKFGIEATIHIEPLEDEDL